MQQMLNMTENLQSVIAGMSPMMQKHLIKALASRMDEAEVARIVEGMSERDQYKDYLTESEARMIVDSFVNFDGSQGAKWEDPSVVFRKADEFGVQKEKEEAYNRWAFYAVVNMIYSDYGGVLRQYVDGDRLARMCMHLAVALLCDKDRSDDKNIRWYLQME